MASLATPDPEELEVKVDCGGGKYTYCQRKDGSAYALRYGKPWIESFSNIPGSNMIFWLAVELDNARAKLVALEREKETGA